MLVETVGVGQSETEIADCADLVVLCVQPASGDGLQFMKAGVMETPDLVLVTKADLGAPARRAAADVRGALAIGRRRRPRWLWSPRNPAMASPRRSTASRTGSAGRSSRLPCRRGGAPRAAHWAESRLVELVGKIGLAALATRVDAQGAPFRAVADPHREGPGGAS